MSERLKFQGRLLEKNQQSKELQLTIEGLRDSLRNDLDPFEPIEGLPDDRIAANAVALSAKLIDYRQLQDEIKAIQKALGK